MQYYRYRLTYRPQFNILLHMYGKLSHQYIVVKCGRIMKKTHLPLISQNQTTKEDGNIITSLGTKMTLPSTFIGDPRFMNQLYQDTISIYWHYFTC